MTLPAFPLVCVVLGAAALVGCSSSPVGGEVARQAAATDGGRTAQLARATLQYEHADPRLGQLPTVYRCDGRDVAVGYVGAQARVTVGGEQAHLLPVPTPTAVPAAWGSRYQLPGDNGTWLAFQGGTLTLSWRGQALGACRVLKPLVSPFTATGHDPAWRLEADAHAITLHWPRAKAPTAPNVPNLPKAPKPTNAADELEGVTVSPLQPLGLGQTVVLGYGAGATEVTVLHRVCHDSVSGLPQPFTAIVRKDGQTLTGCGGDTLSLLQHRTWRLADSPATLQFEPDGRLTGHTGCNVFSGRYRLQGEFLQLDALVTSRKACLGPAMAAEQALMRWLPKVSRHDVADDGHLTLLTADGDAHSAH